MAWDFSTEPEFEEQLAWMRQVRPGRDLPLETLSLSYDAMLEAIKPLQDEVKRRGLWASHLPPELGGGGFGQVKLGLMHEILGPDALRSGGVRQQRPRLGQRRAARHRHRVLGSGGAPPDSGCSPCSTGGCAAGSP